MIEKLIELIKPVVESLNYNFYHLEFVKEDGENYLRIYIDSPHGITLNDCEKVSRRVSDLLDEEDPIPYSYYLEVSSAGIFRTLFTDEHLKMYNGSTVKVSIKGTFQGKKEFLGKLAGFDSEEIYIDIDENEIKIPRKKIKVINLEGEL